MASSIVPIINIEPYFSGDERTKQSIAKELDRACCDTGFFAITGHGIDEDVITRARETVVDFFSQTLEEKLKVERPPEKVSRGYNRLMDRSLSYSIGKEAPPDLQEAFAFGPEEFTGKDWIKNDPSTANDCPPFSAFF